jgi:hypothetical protein
MMNTKVDPCQDFYRYISYNITSQLQLNHVFNRGGRSASKFRKLQIRKLADFNFLDLQIFANVTISGFVIWAPKYFLRTENFRRFIIFLLTNISLKCSHSKVGTTFGLWEDRVFISICVPAFGFQVITTRLGSGKSIK